MIRDKSAEILAAIKSSQKILLHCHPNPDADSVGSSLAMAEALKYLGKEATIIMGDSIPPSGLKHLPGFENILVQNYFETDLSKYDLFIILDSSRADMISKKGEVKFPESLKTIVIDHHASNSGYGDINLIEPEYIATGQMVFELLKGWEIEISKEMAINLMLAIYTDSGGFKYPLTTSETLEAAAELAKIAPEYTDYIFKTENSNVPQTVIFQGLALSKIEQLFSGKVALSTVSFDELASHDIKPEQMAKNEIANILKSVEGWELGICAVEQEKDTLNVSFRTRDSDKYDLSKVSLALGGGGHKAAAGATINKPFDEAKEILVNKVAEIYPELKTSDISI